MVLFCYHQVLQSSSTAYLRWYILLVHHLVEKCHSWMDVLTDHSWDLCEQLCVPQLRFCIFDLQGRRTGVCSAPEQILVTEVPSINLFSFAYSCLWLRESQLLIATAFCVVALFLKLHDLAKKQTNKQTKGCPQVFCWTAKFYIRRGTKLQRTATAQILERTLRGDFYHFVIILHNPISVEGFPHLLKTW